MVQVVYNAWAGSLSLAYLVVARYGATKTTRSEPNFLLSWLAGLAGLDGGWYWLTGCVVTGSRGLLRVLVPEARLDAL